MTQAAYHQVWGDPEGGWAHGSPPWACGALLRRLPDSRLFWVGLVVLGFLAWWPIGLGLLLFSLGSGRMGCGMHGRHGGTRNGGEAQGFAGPRMMRWRGCGRDDRTSAGSGNRAFDEYRAETLRRLEQEQAEFAAFLDRLRFARDKAEFDEFVAARRQPPAPPPASPEEQPPT